MRRSPTTLTFTLLLLLPLGARPAFAHGFGQRYDLPVPLWLYLFGSAAAVLLSFVVLGLFVGEGSVTHRYPRFNLLRVRWFRVVFAGRPLLVGLRLLSVALFFLVILSGLLGDRAPDNNLAPTFVWVIWWVGLGFLTAFVGNFWELVNPWKILFEWTEGLARWLGAEKGLGPYEPYPAGWGVWPALALFFGFAWVELVFTGSYSPFYIAVLALLYSVITWGGMVLFGKDAWLRGGEAFSVFFGILARFAPTEVRVTDPETVCRDCGAACRDDEGDCVNCYECFAWAKPEDRELNLRPPAVGLARPEHVPPGGLVFVVFALASVTFDGLLETPLWSGLLRSVTFPETLGLISVPLLFLALYLGFVKLSQLLGRGGLRFGRLAAAYVYSLVPIAIAYQVAHYFTYLLIQGQAIIAHLSDPFGWGWDLFGTAGYEVDDTIVDAAFVWYSQVALIVAGHVLAVYLAHLIALRLLPTSKRALRSQYPMLVLMVFYTLFSLWILSQPIIEENGESSAEERNAAWADASGGVVEEQQRDPGESVFFLSDSATYTSAPIDAL